MGWFGSKRKEESEIKTIIEEEKETYYMEFRCANCDESTDGYEIPKGTTCEEFMKGRICENCGCLIKESREGE